MGDVPVNSQNNGVIKYALNSTKVPHNIKLTLKFHLDSMS
jgi:hypothetical protein